MTLANHVQGTGRRKTSVARVRLVPGTGKRLVNGVDLDRYFSRITLSRQAIGPLVAGNLVEKYDIHATVHGGGTRGRRERSRSASRERCKSPIRACAGSSARKASSPATRG